MVKILRFAAKAYSSVSGAVGAVAHPIRTAQDAVRGYLVKQCVKAVVALAGERLAQELTTRVQYEKPISLELKVHRRARGMLLDETALDLMGNLVNDALAAPLSALGVRVGAMRFAPDAAGERLCIQGMFKLEAASEPAQKMLQNVR